MITLDDCNKLKESIQQLINKWDPEYDCSCVFSTNDSKREQSKSRYFLESGDKISFFIEEDAIDPNTSEIYLYNILYIFFFW